MPRGAWTQRHVTPMLLRQWAPTLTSLGWSLWKSPKGITACPGTRLRLKLIARATFTQSNLDVQGVGRYSNPPRDPLGIPAIELRVANGLAVQSS